MANYLLEIGLEEIPAHLVTQSENQLIERVKTFLEENLLKYEKIQDFSTPRRLAVLINGLADHSQAKDEEHRGPSLKVAKDVDGNWTRAAEGFARGQKATTADFTERDGYVYLRQHINGLPAYEILTHIGTDVIEKMKFSTYMKWANYKLEYVRPIRWLVSLLDSEVVPFKILDVTAGNLTRGHRFLSKAGIQIPNANSYEDILAGANVIADAKKRKNLIRSQVKKIAADHAWNLHIDENLLEEVTNIVEFPTAFAGSFDDKYLAVPDEVLITSMRDNQRFFYVTDAKQALLPYFISVRNGNGQQIENVVRGNEKVLVARLEDAKFFFEEDSKHSIDFFMKKAEHLVFHEKIGNIVDHMKRVSQIAALLADQLNFTEEQKTDLMRSSAIYKFDLTTAMVGEFSELQGTMAGIYAGIFGENQTVSQALSEQYMPISADGTLPKSEVGALLALADKFDVLFSFFTAKILPSGANDPYGLRRAALGIVRIVDDRRWNFSVRKLLISLKQLLDQRADGFNIKITDPQDLSKELIDFFLDRIRQQRSDVRYDLVDAATNQVKEGIINYIFKRIRILASHTSDPDFRETIEALTRVQNLAEKNPSNAKVNPELLQSASEKHLYELTKQEKVDQLLSEGEESIYAKFALLKDPINDYFQENMIMDKDPLIQANRIAQINLISHLIAQLGDLQKIIVK